MLEKNTKEVNLIVAKVLAFCSLAIIALLLLKIVGVFHFDSVILVILSTAGFVATLTPIFLIRILNENIMKYYMLIMMACVIGALGTQAGIGIYILYFLVPLVSCLYFNRLFTMKIEIICYVIMFISVYFNSANRFEIIYLNWSHFECFRAYMIGFTIEYVIVAIFAYNFVLRAQRTMDEQLLNYRKVQEETIKFQLFFANSTDILMQYSIEDNVYTANRSVFDPPGKGKPVSIANFDKYVKEDMAEFSAVQGILLSGLGANDYSHNEWDFSYKKDGEIVPLWMDCEAYTLRDESGKAVSIIGKMHDITKLKLAQQQLEKNVISDTYLSSIDSEKKSMYELTIKNHGEFTQEESKELENGYTFISELLNLLKSAKDLDSVLYEVLARIGTHFMLDRILIIEINTEERINRVDFQWASRKDYDLVDYFMELNPDEVKRTAEWYDSKGYIEMNPKNGVWYHFNDNTDTNFRKVILPSILGSQIWIPTMQNGEYNGAMTFDKVDTTPYSDIQKFLLAQVVGTVSAFIIRHRAEAANAAKSAFLSSMSHEIRTPMNAIIGMSEVALREEMSEETRKCLNIIKSSSTGLLGIINDILDISKIEAGKIDIIPEEYSLLSLVNDVKTIMDVRNIEKKLDLKFIVSDNIPNTLYGDPVRIKQVMMNFATNAVKYTDTGSVEVKVDCEYTSDNMVELRYFVKDTGMGIRSEDLKYLFLKYSQVDKRRNHGKEGTGLGLAICKQLIDLMGGRIDVSSEYGVGSTFGFVLPQKVMDATVGQKFEEFKYDEEKKEESYLFTAPTARVLVVDDSKVNRKVAKALFKPLEFEIDMAEDGLQAVNKVAVEQYDLILMDHFMPVMDGVEAAKTIRNMEGNPNQNIPIIALTADAVSGVKEKLMQAGMNDFISKPIDMKTACLKMRRFLPEEKVFIKN